MRVRVRVRVRFRVMAWSTLDAAAVREVSEDRRLQLVMSNES